MDLEIKQRPHHEIAEESVISSIFYDPEIINEIKEIIGERCFYFKSLGTIFGVMIEINKKGNTISAEVVKDYLSQKQKLDEIGGDQYLVELANAFSSSSQALEFAKIIYDKYMLRELLSASDEIQSNALSSVNPNETFDFAENKIRRLLELQRKEEFESWEEILAETYNKLLELREKGGILPGLYTRFSKLNNYTGGIQDSDLIIIAARPSVGKTAFALNLAYDIATNSHNDSPHVAFFSLEMPKIQLTQRILSSATTIPADQFRTGKLSDSETSTIKSTLGALEKLNFHIEDKAGSTIGEIKSKCRTLKQEGKLDVVFIDYLQLITANPTSKSDNRQQEVSEISRELKIMAKDLQVPVIALSQLSRAVENRANGKPVMSDLRESGSIEQDADIIMMLHRHDYQQTENITQDSKEGATDLIIAKHRNGPIGEILFVFDSTTVTFNEAADETTAYE
ncbi:MAG: replicative DNA helicase [Mycoplasmatales bacterium]